MSFNDIFQPLKNATLSGSGSLKFGTVNCGLES
jgi:hypothetical protein